jgi:hypothetical protein
LYGSERAHNARKWRLAKRTRDSPPPALPPQESWRDDRNKCTFIVLAANDEDVSAMVAAGSGAAAAATTFSDERLMIGDVNLFFGGDYDDAKAAEVEVGARCVRFCF